MNKKEQRIAITRAFKALLIKSQGEDFGFVEDDAVLLFDYKKDGKLFKDLEYFRGYNEVYNPITRWADRHGDNTEFFAYEKIVDELNDELDEIRAKVEEQAMFEKIEKEMFEKIERAMLEKINKGLGIQK